MNHSVEHENVLTTCYFLNEKTVHVTSFESGKYEINRISNAVFLGVLMFPTILLNAVAITTIWKTPQLRKKICYFVILVQSSVDLGVGCIAIPMLTVLSALPFINVDICIVFIFIKPTTILFIGSSIITLTALTMERYLGVVHPFSYKALVTKKRFVKSVLGGVLIMSAFVIASIFNRDKRMKYVTRGTLVMFFVFIVFAYTRIYIEVQKLSRSDVNPSDNAVGEDNRQKRRLLWEIKHVVSCFIVVVSFAFLLLPYILYPFVLQFVRMTSNAYIWWAASSTAINSSVNSVIFFWRNTVLRKEAIKVMKNILSSENS